MGSEIYELVCGEAGTCHPLGLFTYHSASYHVDYFSFVSCHLVIKLIFLDFKKFHRDGDLLLEGF